MSTASFEKSNEKKIVKIKQLEKRTGGIFVDRFARNSTQLVFVACSESIVIADDSKGIFGNKGLTVHLLPLKIKHKWQ